MKFEIWMEGFAATGERQTAQLLGKVEAKSFKEACIKLCGKDLDKDKDGNVKLSIWACQLYDNEKDARRYFG